MPLVIGAPTLADLEPTLCGELNRNRVDQVRTTILQCLEIEAEDPRVVGIDPRGIDIRSRFDVLRLTLDTPVIDPEMAKDTILAMFASPD